MTQLVRLVDVNMPAPGLMTLLLNEILFHAGMIVIDDQGRIACGTSTNGLTHKLAGCVVINVL